jgi:hypothetical protein
MASNQPEDVVKEEEQIDASASFLSEITGNSVIVKLNSGLEYHGECWFFSCSANQNIVSSKQQF